MWVLFALLLFPAGFAGWAIGHYSSLGKPSATVTRTVTAASPTTATTPTTPATTGGGTTAATTTGGSGGGNVASGKTLFTSQGCASCHTFAPANATGQVGPNLDTAPSSDAKADNNMALAAFVKQSIVDPNAYIAKGYSSGIMPQTFGKQLKPSEIDDLVAFIVSGAKS
jgi:cytochrome c551/c552